MTGDNSEENEFVVLYTLIELRARARAADDVLALSSDNIRRILQAAQWYLVESNHGPEVSGKELELLARHTSKIVNFYHKHLVEWQRKVRNNFETYMASAQSLIEFMGSREKFLNFVDQLINIEALDIDLSKEAASLDLPPTITNEMIKNVEKKWVPSYVLKSVEEDRRLLIKVRKQIEEFVGPDPEKQDADMARWAGNIAAYICHNSVFYY